MNVYLFAEPGELRGDAAKNYDRWRELGETVTVVRGEEDWIKAWTGVAASEVIIDALLGTGIRGGASGLLAQVIENLNRFSQDAKAAWPAWIVAVDTPSGLPSDGEAAQGPVLRAHLTVTFTAPKIGQLVSADAGSCGSLVVREIGTPAALVEEVGKGKLRWAGPEEFSELPLQRAAESHKGSYGHVLLVAGSVGKNGRGDIVRAGGTARWCGIGDIGYARACACHGRGGAGRVHDGSAAGDGFRNSRF